MQSQMNTTVFKKYYDDALKVLATDILMARSVESNDEFAERMIGLQKFNSLVDRVGNLEGSVPMHSDKKDAEKITGYSIYSPSLDDLAFFEHADALSEVTENALFGEHLEKADSVARDCRHINLERCLKNMEDALSGKDYRIVTISEFTVLPCGKDVDIDIDAITKALNEGTDTGCIIVTDEENLYMGLDTMADYIYDADLNCRDFSIDVPDNVKSDMEDVWNEAVEDKFNPMSDYGHYQAPAYTDSQIESMLEDINEESVRVSEVEVRSNYELVPLYMVVSYPEMSEELLVKLPIVKVKDLASTGEYPEYMTFDEVYNAVRENEMFDFIAKEVSYEDYTFGCFESASDGEELMWKCLTDKDMVDAEKDIVLTTNLNLTEINKREVQEKEINPEKMSIITMQDMDAIGMQKLSSKQISR